MEGGFEVGDIRAPLARGVHACFTPPEPSCRTGWLVKAHLVMQALIIPWSNCESVEIVHLESEHYLDYFGGQQDVDWNRRIFSCSRHDEREVDYKSGSESGGAHSSFDLIDPDAPAFENGFWLFFCDWVDNPYEIAERVFDFESYQYGHRNSWLSADGAVKMNDGYSDCLEFSAVSFVGKS